MIDNARKIKAHGLKSTAISCMFKQHFIQAAVLTGVRQYQWIHYSSSKVHESICSGTLLTRSATVNVLFSYTCQTERSALSNSTYGKQSLSLTTDCFMETYASEICNLLFNEHGRLRAFSKQIQWWRHIVPAYVSAERTHVNRALCIVPYADTSWRVDLALWLSPAFLMRKAYQAQVELCVKDPLMLLPWQQLFFLGSILSK